MNGAVFSIINPRSQDIVDVLFRASDLFTPIHSNLAIRNDPLSLRPLQPQQWANSPGCPAVLLFPPVWKKARLNDFFESCSDLTKLTFSEWASAFSARMEAPLIPLFKKYRIAILEFSPSLRS
jgi:hypothetical protein